jgi:hypothetical protein
MAILRNEAVSMGERGMTVSGRLRAVCAQLGRLDKCGDRS